jgi:hypothetical protein
VLNAVLACGLLAGRRPDVAVAPAAAPAAPAAAAPTIDAAIWPALEGGNLAELAARLRVSGFPPDIVRAIVAARIRESFAARRRALLATADSAPFWKEQARDPATQAALLQLDREARRQLRELLGDDPDEEQPGRPRQFDFLPAEKSAEVRRLLRDFEERRSELYAAGAGRTTDREKFTALEREQEAALAAVLTPAELLEYNFRHGTLANTLREELAAFRPTEEEYRAIHALRAEYAAALAPPVGAITLSSAENRTRTAAQQAIMEQLRARLGPDRAAEYERAIDSNYRRTSQLVARLDLPAETTGRIWTVQKEFEQRRNDLYRQSAPGNIAERNRQLAALQQEAVTRLTPLLGQVGVEAYRQYGGSWLQSMVPRPAAPPPR